MFKLLVQKELKSILLSPKFIATFATCSILIIFSIFIGIQEYKANVKQYQAAAQLDEQEMSQANSWLGVRNRAYRAPDPMQIFVSGINNDIGRFSNISNWAGIKLQNSNYSDEPIYAIFRFLDFSFIVLIVLSLFAILFTYDLINGERESGTLRLIFSNSVPRAKFIIAKFLGSWLGLILPLSIPILLGLLLIMLFRIPFDSGHWIRLFTLLSISVLFFTFFMAFGLLVSTLTKRSSVSFLFLLVFWVLFIFIIPRIGVMTAGQIIDVPTVAQMESQLDSYTHERWEKRGQEMTEVMKKRSAEMEGMSESERKDYSDKKGWEWMQEDDASRKVIEKDIAEYSRKASEDLRNKRIQQEKLAFILSRFSPASAFQLAAMNIGGSDISVKTRYEDAMQAYKTAFSEYVNKKQKESGSAGVFRIKIDSKSGISISDGRKDRALDLKELPRFKDPVQSFSEVFSSTIIDLGILSIFTLLSIAGAFIAFLRYDLR